MIRHYAASRIIAIALLLIAWFALSPSTSTAQTPDLGIGASLHGKQVLPADNAWNQDISQMPVDVNSTNLLTSIGLTTGLHPDFGAPFNGVPSGIPYIVVSGGQARVPVTFQYASESDPGPYPVPANAPIEGGPGGTGDRHVLVVDRDNWVLYELFGAFPNADYSAWSAGSGAVFDLSSNTPRPQGFTSADAAGLPIFPGLIRYDEVFEQGAINHALRFTVQHTRNAFVYPARHYASSLTGSNLPPMGMRVRLKASFNIAGFSPAVQVILKALKKYGMFVADNGSNWFVSGAPDDRWNDSDLHTLGQVHGSDFEVVQMGPVTTDSLATPTGLRAIAGAGSVALSWAASSNASSYSIKRSITAGGPYTPVQTGIAGTSTTDTGLTAGTTYYYVVAAVNGDQQSFDSNEVSATPSSQNSSNRATFVKTDSSTQGNWKGVYGKDGFSLANDSTSLPAYAAIGVSGNSNCTWLASTADARAPLKGASPTDRLAACWYSPTSFTYDLNLTDGQAHQIAFYGLDWDSTSRAEQVDILDASTGAVLSSQSLSAFNAGKYLVWSITGHVQVKVTSTGRPNAVISGIFFDGAAASGQPALSSVSVSPTSVTGGSSATGTVTLTSAAVSSTAVSLSSSNAAATVPATVTIAAGQTSATFSVATTTVATSTTATLTASYGGASKTAVLTVTPAAASGGNAATFIKTDAATQGNWKGVYGKDGFSINFDSTSLPAYAAISVSGNSDWAWAGTTSDPRALLKSASPTDRLAACWYSPTSFTYDLNLTDGQAHQIAFYGLDWDSTSRAEQVDILDASTGAVLSSQSLSAFSSGKYLVWSITGHVQVKVTSTGSPNAVISGIFFGGGAPSAPSSSATFVKTDSSTQGNWKGVYGKDGFSLANDSTSLPAYAAIGVSGNSNCTWLASTADARAPLKGASPTDRLAACWYSPTSFTYDLNLTDGQAHQIAFYGLDWDSTSRAEQVDILDASTGAVLSSQSLSAFNAGKYLVWSITGHVQVKVTSTGRPNAVISGIFFN